MALHIPGTKVSIQNAQLLISSGIQSLDEIIGGGLPIGTIVLVQEDANCNYAKFLVKYFLAEGVSHKHPLFIASKDTNTQSLVKELPKATTIMDETADVETADEERMKIAFRYKNLPSAATEHTEQLRYFDLSTRISATDLSNTDTTHWSEAKTDDPYTDLLQSIHRTLHKRSLFLTDKTDHRSVLRIVLHSVGSPNWRTDSDSDNRKIQKFFVTLRALVRQAYAVAFVTVPSRLWIRSGSDGSLLDKCVNASDICLRLHSFSGTDLESNASLSKYHGFFYVDKIAAINSLTSKYQGPVDYAFKLLRRKFCVETLHLPPELQESTEREQDDVVSVSCGSGNRRLLDF